LSRQVKHNNIIRQRLNYLNFDLNTNIYIFSVVVNSLIRYKLYLVEMFIQVKTLFINFILNYVGIFENRSYYLIVTHFKKWLVSEI